MTDPRAIPAEALRFRRKGHRLGLFIVILSIPLALTGVLTMGDYTGQFAWANATCAIGWLGLIFGYPLARLWFWFRAA